MSEDAGTLNLAPPNPPTPAPQESPTVEHRLNLPPRLAKCFLDGRNQEQVE